MSWNLATQFNNLKVAYQNIATTALTNPMVANLNMNGYVVNNCNSFNAQPANTLELNSDVEVKSNSVVNVNNQLRVSATGAIQDSVKVSGSGAGLNQYFRVDNVGNVGVRVADSTPLTNALTINGNVIADNLVNSINVVSPLVKTGTNANPILSIDLPATEVPYSVITPAKLLAVGADPNEYVAQIPSKMGVIYINQPPAPLTANEYVTIRLPTTPCAFYLYTQQDRGGSSVPNHLRIGNYTYSSAITTIKYFVFWDQFKTSNPAEGDFSVWDLAVAPFASPPTLNGIGTLGAPPAV